MRRTQIRYDCIIAGAGFGGLACAIALADRNYNVRVVEKKARVDEKLRTTGIIVKEAIDGIALLDSLPPSHVRKIPAVRLYAPSMRSLRLEVPGRYFLATDTAAVMRWLASQATEAGAELAFSSAFTGARRIRSGWDLGRQGSCRFLVGADGSRSAVAAALGLGANRKLLHGIEYEYALEPEGPRLPESDALHCFVDRKLAPGYIAWLLQGVGQLQLGLARRGKRRAAGLKSAMPALLDKVAPLVDLAGCRPSSIRAGPIPCGGLVQPLACNRALLVGDAAGMVSPLTAGGIHTALRHGLAVGHAVADFLAGRSADPKTLLASRYPRFRRKRMLRLAFDHLQTDWMLNALLSTRLMRQAARKIYFHR